MEYEGKNKIIYIGTVVLFVAFIIIYAVYFITGGAANEKKKTTEAIQVNSTVEEEKILVNGEAIAKEISSEIAMISVIKVEEPVKEEEPAPIITPKKAIVRRNNTYVLAANQEQPVQEVPAEEPAPVEVKEENTDMQDVIVEETHEEVTPVVTPEVSEPIVNENEESNEE